MGREEGGTQKRERDDSTVTFFICYIEIDFSKSDTIKPKGEMMKESSSFKLFDSISVNMKRCGVKGATY